MLKMRIFILAAGLAFLASATAEDKKDEKKPLDPAKLVGKWVFVEGKKAGEKAPDDMGKTAVVIEKEIISLKSPDGEFEFKYTVDVKADPAAIDMEITKPEGFKGAKAPGIIKLEGGKVTLCYAPMGGDRPKKFESTKDNGYYLFVMKAKEEKKKEEKK